MPSAHVGGRRPLSGILVVYGRQPVVEALSDPAVEVDRVLLDRTLRGEFVDRVLALAASRGITVQRVAPERVGRASGNPRQDQGVVADVVAKDIVELDEWLLSSAASSSRPLFVLDGVTNPTNVGMVLRAAVGAGMAGTVVPSAGVPDLGSLVVKASAGVALRATVLRSPSAAVAVTSLRAAGWSVVVLAGDGEPLWSWRPSGNTAFVLGNENSGVSDSVRAAASGAVAIPLEGGVESLNVATAAAVVAFELQRQRGDI